MLLVLGLLLNVSSGTRSETTCIQCIAEPGGCASPDVHGHKLFDVAAVVAAGNALAAGAF